MSFPGTVYEVGEGVDEWTPGNGSRRSAVYCGSCVHCRNHRWNHCKRWNAIGVTMNGAFAEYVRVPAKNLYRLPEGISFEEGALIEPLSCVAYALNRIDRNSGRRALIFGGGPMGLMLLMALKKRAEPPKWFWWISRKRNWRRRRDWVPTPCTMAENLWKAAWSPNIPTVLILWWMPPGFGRH